MLLSSASGYWTAQQDEIPPLVAAMARRAMWSRLSPLESSTGSLGGPRPFLDRSSTLPRLFPDSSPPFECPPVPCSRTPSQLPTSCHPPPRRAVTSRPQQATRTNRHRAVVARPPKPTNAGSTRPELAQRPSRTGSPCGPRSPLEPPTDPSLPSTSVARHRPRSSAQPPSNPHPTPPHLRSRPENLAWERRVVVLAAADLLFDSSLTSLQEPAPWPVCADLFSGMLGRSVARRDRRRLSLAR